MLLKLVGKNIDLTETLKEKAQKKFEKLDRYFDDEIEGKAVFSTQKNNKTVEVTILLPGTILRAEETTEDMYASIDKALSVLERQVRKYKTKLKNRYQDNSKTIRFGNVEEIEAEAESKIVKRKTINLRPMSEEEAILQMELLNHNFFIYKDSDTNMTKVLYKRRDEQYGLIDVD